VLNIEADKESRKCEQRLEWQLDPTIFGEANEHLGFQPTSKGGKALFLAEISNAAGWSGFETFA